MARTARHDADASRRLDQLGASGVPLVALAAYSRWWAVETWLRELTYIELRAKFGPAWQSEISSKAHRRRDMDEATEYMRSADVSNVLAYEDVKFLLTLIEEHWDLFHPSLLPSATQWRARAEELLQIRHRIGHCRYPHKDDIARIEQTLRDLEPGAWKAVTAYNHMHSIPKDLEDPVVEAWLREGCSDAQRLVGHAERNYETSLRIEYSRRPWASRDRPATITGQEGIIWVIRFVLRARRVHPVRVLMEWNENSPMPECIVHLLSDDPAHLLFTISALEDPATVIDVIGRLFDTVLTSSTGWDDYESDVSDWRKALPHLGHRAQWNTGLVLANDDLPGFPLLLTSAWSG